MTDMVLGETRDAREPGIIRGVSVAVVSQNQDPDGLGRVKVRFPWRENPDESYWARIAVPMAGNDRGTWFLPEVGDEVLVACEADRVEHPYVIGALWNGQDKPPETNADGSNDIRKIRSRSGHEIVFDDGAQGRIHVHLKDDARKVTLDQNGIEISDDSGNSITLTSSPGSIAIKSNVKISIESSTVEIKANASMTLQASGTLTVQGALVRIN
ncbi:MAG TPA: phage baseplate assembly protein V [Vicinamibacterales bacterium]|nr:phage baseplate assembly protein V [Vicinamibacterales bacterium]